MARLKSRPFKTMTFSSHSKAWAYPLKRNEMQRQQEGYGAWWFGLVLEAVAEFCVNFARVVVVEAAEGEAVVEQDSAVGDVGCGDGCGEFLAEGFAYREIEGCVLG